MPEFYMILARKIIKIPDFYYICPKNLQNSRILHDFCPKNARILRDNCPKNIFARILGGHVPPYPPPPVSYAYVLSHKNICCKAVWGSCFLCCIEWVVCSPISLFFTTANMSLFLKLIFCVMWCGYNKQILCFKPFYHTQNDTINRYFCAALNRMFAGMTVFFSMF